MDITFQKSLNGSGISVKLNDFEPIEGYESFLKRLCSKWKERFIDWCQSDKSGAGRITYQGKEVAVFLAYLPFALSFDCLDEKTASELQASLKRYLPID